MRRAFIDPAAVSKGLIVILIGFLFVYMIYSMMLFGDGNAGREAANVQATIEKALVQCYALEGSYPTEVEYVSQYGVVFDNDRYVYFYEWYGSNLKPTIKVFEK